MDRTPQKWSLPFLRPLFSRAFWTRRIRNFSPAWFVSSMGTGILAQLFTNFPYSAKWLQDTVAYCFWVLTILMFSFFIILGVLRLIYYPRISRDILKKFNESSYLGAITITLDSITSGLCVFYGDRAASIWIAYSLYWTAVVMSVLVGCVVVFSTYALQHSPKFQEITPVWMLSFIPFIVTSSTGAEVVQYVALGNEQAILITSFLMWSVGISMCLMIMTIYFLRLTIHGLPDRDAICSCFIPMGPTGMGAFAIQNLAVGLSSLIEQNRFILHRALPPNRSLIVISAVSEMMNWVGLLISLTLVSLSTFWLIEALFSVATYFPKRFNVGLWALVFPNGAYSNALCQISKDLNNDVIRVWAAFCTSLTVIFWVSCAIITIFKGSSFQESVFDPGLEGLNTDSEIKDGVGI